MQLDVARMAVGDGFATEGIDHVVPVKAQEPMLVKLLADRQTAIHWSAIDDALWRLLGVIYHLHAYLPLVRKACGGRKAHNGVCHIS